MFRGLVNTDGLSRRGATGVAPAAGTNVDLDRLALDLRNAVAGEVRFDAGSRALYATDASNYRQVPLGVVIPRNVDDVIATVAVCLHHHAPLLSRGGGTSLCGQCCNVAVVLDFSKYMNRVLEIDAAAKTARVQPGTVLDTLRTQANAHGLTFAPDPATHSHNTLGGMIGNNSCGPHSVLGGTTAENVLELDVLTYDGERMTVGATDDEALARIVADGGRRGDIYQRLDTLGRRHAKAIGQRFPNIPRRVSGYNLPPLLAENGRNLAQALVGSEGTCVVILEARLRLVDWPRARTLLVLGYPSVFEAGDHVPDIMAAGPIALEGLDDRLVADMKAARIHPENAALLPAGGGWLMVEFGGADKAEADGRARTLMDRLARAPNAPTMKLYDDPNEEALVWKVRESGLGATAHVPDKPITWEGWEDSSVPPQNLGRYLRALRDLFDRYGYACDLYGHFGQGCVHTRIDFDLETAAGIEHYRRFIHDAAHLAVGLGGSISGEHGDGQSKAELLPIMFGDELMGAFREFKAIWDPDNRMNPGKVIDAYRADENLRLGTAYSPPQPSTVFAFPADRHNFSRTLLRCVGVGECRKQAGVMCPSYMATGEEMHSTRGRAHLLFEMLRGETLTGGWREPAVKEALDLCLSCKGCKGDCPVHVDMAVYKAEFLSHYYEGRLRPPAAYAFGLIDRWARMAAHAPKLVNFFSQHQPFADITKAALGIAPQRRLPPFAEETFTRAFRRQSARGHDSGKPVLLWPDTFNNHFHPNVALAAVRVLRHAGFAVQIPSVPLCCGRPLYEIGMLDRARDYLHRILRTLDGEIRAGMPLVVLEPACLSVFREEMPQLLHGDEQALRLKRQSFLLSEFLERETPHLTWPQQPGRALVHFHCHHKSVLGVDAETSLLGKLGLELEIPDSGCCGMAGSFGFEKAKYEVSLRCAERALLPAIHAAIEDTLLIADGYACREQIEQLTGRRPLHPAQVLERALQGEPS